MAIQGAMRYNITKPRSQELVVSDFSFASVMKYQCDLKQIKLSRFHFLLFLDEVTVLNKIKRYSEFEKAIN